MKSTIKYISLTLVFLLIHTSLVQAEFFLSSNCSEKNQEIKVGYKIKFGADYRTTQQKLNASTSAGENFFDSVELETFAFLMILALLLTAVRGTESASSVGGTSSSTQDGVVFEDSKLEQTSEEIKASEQVTDATIPETNIPATTS